MSRLQMLLDKPSVATFPKSELANRVALKPEVPSLDFAHRLFVPEHYEPGYAYPLVVWLHSDDSSELELDPVMENLSVRNYIAVAPRANIKSHRSNRLFRWGHSQTNCAVAEDLVWDCVHELCATMSVHPDRVFLAGYGGGATMAQWIGLKYAEHVAGVVSFNGSFPTTERPLANWKNARQLQVLFGQRSQSSLCTDDQLIDAVRTSHRAGLKYRFWQLNDADDTAETRDDLDTTMLQAANRFMMSIVTGTEMNLEPEIAYNQGFADFGSN